MYGQTPYHPNRKPKGPKPHPAMTVPGHLTLDDRPAGATRRSRFGHYEMDTVVSSTNGTGGLLVLVDRRSRRYVIEKLGHVTQDDVVAALRRMIARKALGKVRENCCYLFVFQYFCVSVLLCFCVFVSFVSFVSCTMCPTKLAPPPSRTVIVRPHHDAVPHHNRAQGPLWRQSWAP